MGAILAFLKRVYEHKEKVILGVLILVFAAVAFVQIRSRKSSSSEEGNGKNPEELINDDWQPAPKREPRKITVPLVSNPVSLNNYTRVLERKMIFGKPASESDKGKGQEELVEIKVKSIFDPTHSGSYIAILEVNKKSRIVKEGEQFEGFEVRRIDGVRNCLTISRREWKEEKEFCKEAQ